jgi:hypothetical protein
MRKSKQESVKARERIVTVAAEEFREHGGASWEPMSAE